MMHISKYGHVSIRHRFVFDDFGAIGKVSLSAFQRHHFHQNWSSIDPIHGHILISSSFNGMFIQRGNRTPDKSRNLIHVMRRQWHTVSVFVFERNIAAGAGRIIVDIQVYISAAVANGCVLITAIAAVFRYKIFKYVHYLSIPGMLLLYYHLEGTDHNLYATSTMGFSRDIEHSDICRFT